LWDKYPIKLQTEQMLTPVELKLYNQIKLLNLKKLKALQEKPVVDCKKTVQEIVAPRPDATAELYQAAKNN
jgi:tRNA (Thr-GGU) A37 N-methylase